VAIGIGRLGHDVVLAARVGPDSRGQVITQHVLDSGVALIDDVNGLPRTSTASATIAEDGSASYEFDLLWDITPDMLPRAVLLPRPYRLHWRNTGAREHRGSRDCHPAASCWSEHQL
jgi:sugar/nucleoside kinase (ribokinase family)